MINIEIIKKIFEDSSWKSTIAIKGKCSDCDCEVIIEITPTSGGFGLQGGALFECLPDVYVAKCPDCYKINPKTDSHYKPKYKYIIIN